MKIGDVVYLVERSGYSTAVTALEVEIMTDFIKSTRAYDNFSWICMVKPLRSFDAETGWKIYEGSSKTTILQRRVRQKDLCTTSFEAISKLKMQLADAIKQRTQYYESAKRQLLETQIHVTNCEVTLASLKKVDLESVFNGEKYISIFTGQEL